MKAAVVLEAGKPPVYTDFKEPAPGLGEALVTVSAAALSPLAKGRASGTHYSSDAEVPFAAGVDGVGRLADGRRVYFVLPRAPFGSMAERSVVDAALCVPLPAGLDEVQAAAIANPGMSSWAALKERARLVAGETVLVNGATGTSGQLAVRIARLLGARKVIATGRNRALLDALPADVHIPLVDDGQALETAFKAQFAQGIDVVLDYLWGPSAERLVVAAAKAAPEGRRIRYVEIGNASAPTISLPGAALRAGGLELMGSGIGSVPVPRLLKAIGELFQAATAGGLKIATKSVPLAEVGKAWAGDADGRIVFTLA
jgi:NADPH:quinone reductase-like Zn-dependent oxidoreductase